MKTVQVYLNIGTILNVEQLLKFHDIGQTIEIFFYCNSEVIFDKHFNLPFCNWLLFLNLWNIYGPRLSQEDFAT